MQLEIKQRGVASTYRALAAISHRAEDARPAWKLLFADLEDDAKRRFGTGEGWEPTAESTLARDARGGRDSKLMRVTGRLDRSLTQRFAAGAIRESHPRDMRYGTDIFYAAFHHFGQGVPERKLIEMDEREQDDVARILERYLVGEHQGL
jgi:phage gpG-like protein